MLDKSRLPKALASSCRCAVSRVISVAESAAPVPRKCSGAGPKSPLDSPCRHSSGNTSVICGDLRAHAGKIGEENRHRSPVSASMRLSLTRGALTGTAPAAVNTVRSSW
ncbi:hypothetical protein MYCOZU1_00965 [Mycobacterium intracellulare subsp. chimaera]|uniref:Uncharacterized protein n=1 Tax=Mycobacterium intracellulare subsp. chimaera TaxID=222805 RepID=A0A220Y6U9_MYCIT|nr:hypothetical protein MYCODSM44623_00869 [Mycobacterium intracellulare subsp. chimaera]ASL13290.1 hypothetical protein MYCOZU2_00838 [Mycobacterium intracellulare subsp. chimaera]ASL19426.1 hypothetical protein MYCOZU1_00965 [Mycobacterium intracellulare subsp. chimaera]